MKSILITGATGNIGIEVIRYLIELKSNINIVAGVRNIEKAKTSLNEFENIKFLNFDFEDTSSYNNTLKNIDTLFLLRPPHISNVEKYIKPLIEKAKHDNVKEIIFLSVQGAEKSKVIPHNKIERLIVNSGIDYIFLRPSYFMQNLTTTLKKDIENRRIVLPSARAKFNWVDVNNIGEVVSLLIQQFDKYKDQAIEITGSENENFYFVADLITTITKERMFYKSVNPLSFYFYKKKQGVPKAMILVMLMLHFLPRVQKEPEISGFYKKITGKKPTTLKDFIEREF